MDGLLQAYLAHRADPAESFFAFTRRNNVETLKRMAEEALA